MNNIGKVCRAMQEIVAIHQILYWTSKFLFQSGLLNTPGSRKPKSITSKTWPTQFFSYDLIWSRSISRWHFWNEIGVKSIVLWRCISCPNFKFLALVDLKWELNARRLVKKENARRVKKRITEADKIIFNPSLEFAKEQTEKKTLVQVYQFPT